MTSLSTVALLCGCVLFENTDLWKSYTPVERKILTGLISKDIEVRDEAITSIEKLSPQAQNAAVPLLQQLLQGRDSQARLLVLHGLRGLGARAKPLLPTIITFCEEKSKTRTSCAALSALSSLGPHAQKAIPVLIRALHEENRDAEHDYWTRIPFTLMNLAPKDPKVLAELKYCLGHKHHRLRMSAAWVLWSHNHSRKKSFRVLVDLLKSPILEVRERSARYLGLMGNDAKTAVRPLIDNLQDKERRVREAALDALSEIDPQNNEVILASIRALGDSDGNVRYYATTILAESNKLKDQVKPALIQSLSDKDGLVRNYIAFALWKVDSSELKRVIPIFIDLLKHKEPFVRKAVCESLGKIGPPAKAAVPLLLKAQQDSWTKREAMEALRLILPKGHIQ